jgi:beta-glucosidase
MFSISCLQMGVSAVNVSKMPDPTTPIQPGGNAELWATLATISATVTNTGSVARATMAQLYLSYPNEANAPALILRGFEKIALDAGASGTLQFPLTRRDLSYWGDWYEYRVQFQTSATTREAHCSHFRTHVRNMTIEQ